MRLTDSRLFQLKHTPRQGVACQEPDVGVSVVEIDPVTNDPVGMPATSESMISRMPLAPFPGPRSVTRIKHWLVLITFAISVGGASAADLLDSPFEELVQTPVITAQARIQAFNDAASAVSVITAEDIRNYGYRNLKEILNGMRGLYAFDYFRFDLLNTRGYSPSFGTDGGLKLDSRLMLLIDGRNVGDIQLGQVLLGSNQLLDVNLIERVEYVPGAGSVRYADTAFLGSINIVTKRGGSLPGARFAAGFGRNGEQYQRLQYGGPLSHGGEVLVAYSNLATGTLPILGRDEERIQTQDSGNKQLLLQLRWPEWQFMLVHGQSDALVRIKVNSGLSAIQDDIETAYEHTHASLGYNTDLSAQLKSSSHLFFGQRKNFYRAFDDDIGKSSWWGLEQEWAYQVNDHHTLLAGLSLRDDFKISFSYPDFLLSGDWGRKEINSERRRVSAYLYDEWQYLPTVKIGVGARYDHIDQGNSNWSPRASIQWQATPRTQFKLSHAVTYRDATQYEVRFSPRLAGRQEQLQLTEFAVQHRPNENAQLLASVYHYRINDYFDHSIRAIKVSGQELEYSRQWESGWRTRVSITHQQARNIHDSQSNNDLSGIGIAVPTLQNADKMEKRQYSPRFIGKLNLSVPLQLAGKEAVIGLDSRYVSRYDDFASRKFGNAAITNITLNVPRLFNHVSGSVTIGNVFNGQSAAGGSATLNRRSVWVQLEYRFK